MLKKIVYYAQHFLVHFKKEVNKFSFKRDASMDEGINNKKNVKPVKLLYLKID